MLKVLEIVVSILRKIGRILAIVVVIVAKKMTIFEFHKGADFLQLLFFNPSSSGLGNTMSNLKHTCWIVEKVEILWTILEIPLNILEIALKLLKEDWQF